jgi:hypothetical protein
MRHPRLESSPIPSNPHWIPQKYLSFCMCYPTAASCCMNTGSWDRMSRYTWWYLSVYKTLADHRINYTLIPILMLTRIDNWSILPNLDGQFHRESCVKCPNTSCLIYPAFCELIRLSHVKTRHLFRLYISFFIIMIHLARRCFSASLAF